MSPPFGPSWGLRREGVPEGGSLTRLGDYTALEVLTGSPPLVEVVRRTSPL
jgi:hypothetical protein